MYEWSSPNYYFKTILSLVSWNYLKDDSQVAAVYVGYSLGLYIGCSQLKTIKDAFLNARCVCETG